MLKLAVFLIVPVVVTALLVIAPLWNGALSPSQQERAIGIRMTLFTWVMAALLGAALILLPNKSRVLMLVPVFVTAVVLGKIWRRARLRAREEAERPATDIEHMKRVKEPVSSVS